jgi:hypothetical protein
VRRVWASSTTIDRTRGASERLSLPGYSLDFQQALAQSGDDRRKLALFGHFGQASPTQHIVPFALIPAFIRNAEDY